MRVHPASVTFNEILGLSLLRQKTTSQDFQTRTDRVPDKNCVPRVVIGVHHSEPWNQNSGPLNALSLDRSRSFFRHRGHLFARTGPSSPRNCVALDSGNPCNTGSQLWLWECQLKDRQLWEIDDHPDCRLPLCSALLNHKHLHNHLDVLDLWNLHCLLHIWVTTKRRISTVFWILWLVSIGLCIITGSSH